ncbi:MAG: sulfite exporter TauE/SafE family protein [Gammaproteobacteria bacterium]|nr:MAG: sulfite exporter TauE/SafE family protein [Gammaproteobacteria bacterium]
MIDPAVLISSVFFPLFIMGLVSSAHCIGMCGGIMGALTMAIPQNAKASRSLILVAYNLGRICSYTVMGALAGLFAEQFAALGGGPILRILAGTLLVAMGLYLADWWRGLTKLEVLGRYLWAYIQPVGKRLMPVNTPAKALLLGGIWGWLPCGLVYSALALAMTQPAPSLAAGAMLAFGLGTLPAVLAAGVAAQQLTRILQQPKLRAGLALIIIAFGVWTIWGSLGHAHGHHQHSDLSVPATADHSKMDHSETDHSKMDHTNMNHSGAEHSEMNRSEAGHLEMDRSGENHTTHDHLQMHPPEASERQRTDREGGAAEDMKTAPGSTASSEATD